MVRLPRQTTASRRPKLSRGPAGECPGAFNAHSPDGTGRGLAQHVLRSPARTPPEGSPRKAPCAALANVKRCTLSWGRFGLRHGQASVVSALERDYSIDRIHRSWHSRQARLTELHIKVTIVDC